MKHCETIIMATMSGSVRQFICSSPYNFARVVERSLQHVRSIRIVPRSPHFKNPPPPIPMVVEGLFFSFFLWPLRLNYAHLSVALVSSFYDHSDSTMRTSQLP